jgi:hypothetical protein
MRCKNVITIQAIEQLVFAPSEERQGISINDERSPLS